MVECARSGRWTNRVLSSCVVRVRGVVTWIGEIGVFCRSRTFGVMFIFFFFFHLHWPRSESLKSKKRKLSIQKLEPALSIEYVSKKSKTSEFVVDSYETGPVGFIWDKLNWNCCYDAVLTIFLRIWSMKPAVWTTEFSNTNVFMHTLALEFQKIQNNNQIMEQTRDSMHTYLHLQSPSMFPMGTQGAAVMNVLSTVLDEKSCGTINLYCKSCLYTSSSRLDQHQTC